MKTEAQVRLGRARKSYEGREEITPPGWAGCRPEAVSLPDDGKHVCRCTCLLSLHGSVTGLVGMLPLFVFLLSTILNIVRLNDILIVLLDHEPQMRGRTVYTA